MNAFFEHPKVKHKIIYVLMLSFLVVKSLTLYYYKVVWWDSSVYIGMGKYLYSFGHAGLWESSRPIVWPLILGLFWKIGLNVAVIGRVLEIIFGGFCILLTYLTGKKLFDEKTALLASLFLALSPTFFFFNGIMLTEIVSTFFALVAVYFFIDKKYFISGIFLGIAFMARFLQLFVFIAMFLTLISNKKYIKICIKIFAGFIIAITPYLILNQILYTNIFFPFLQQIYLSKNSGWLNYHGSGFYFIELFKENFLYLLFIFGVFLLFKNKDTNKRIIAIVFIIFFILFNLIQQKEMRFLIVLFPYMYLLISSSIIHVFTNFKNKISGNVLNAVIILSFLLSLSTTLDYYKNESNKNNQYNLIQDILEKVAQGKIWVSNPIITVFTDKKIDKLMYYPVFNEEKKNELTKNSKQADFIFLDSCDLACSPDDASCKNRKNQLLTYFKQQLKTIYSLKTNECNQFVFQQ